MSTNFAEIVNIDYVKPHPNADRLEIAIVRGATVVIGKDFLKRDDKAVYFPPDMLVRADVADKLQVSKYLKHAIYPGDIHKTQCRVAACRLRQEPSYGFLTEVPSELAHLPIGSNADEHFHSCKYEPPVRAMYGDQAYEHKLFHRYTSIEHYWRYPQAFSEGTQVRITEKIHGTNSRVGVLKTAEGDFEFVAGSHRTQRKPPAEGQQTPLYWRPLDNAGVLTILNELCDEKNSVIIFGEIYGQGIQDMDYGQTAEIGYRVFDISVNGAYLSWHQVEAMCKANNVETVPLLYVGPFKPELIQEMTHGPTTIAHANQIKSDYKGREGIVITALQESYSGILRDRLIVKSVSADYLHRKGAEDNE